MPDIFQDSSRYFHISAFYALSLPYYHMEHHTHSSYEIMYITSGSCRVFCLDGTQDTEFPLKSGQFIFIRPDVPHRLEIPDDFPGSGILWKPPRAFAPARIPAASDTA